MIPANLSVQHDVVLSPLTTINLGGKAKYLAFCASDNQIREALLFGKQEGLRVFVLGGGSNVVFADEGFNGLVIWIQSQGVTFKEEGDFVRVTAAAGEVWDPLVELCIEKGLAGIECLSGIPGLVGATPIQNVGAYGQEVKDTIASVKAIDRQTLASVELTNQECRFGYRQSRFKSDDIDKYIITEVTFRLKKNGRPEIRYPELAKSIAASTDLKSIPSGEPALRTARKAVLALRRGKSMVADPADPHSRSVGSFFTNPILPKEQFADVEYRWKNQGRSGDVPVFSSGDRFKIPAAWFVENAGFPRGFRVGGVGISKNHALALVNYSGSTREILDLAVRIQRAVHEQFGIMLEREPVVVSA